jgi:large conductance mechanosensitive channel
MASNEGAIMYKEFMTFLKNYGVVGLAIAVIIGGKLNLLVTSFVNDLITPLILQPALNAAGVSNLAELNYNGVLYGKVIAASLDFIVVAFIVFLFAKKVMKEDLVAKK